MKEKDSSKRRRKILRDNKKARIFATSEKKNNFKHDQNFERNFFKKHFFIGIFMLEKKIHERYFSFPRIKIFPVFFDLRII